MTFNILLINAHPKAGSYCDSIADEYERGAAEGNTSIERVNLRDLSFDPIFLGYDQNQPLEKDLQRLQHQIERADHLVFVYPIWWGNVPGLLKAAIDRVFLPGFGFRFESGRLTQRKLLKGKTARLLATMDAPSPIYKWVYGSPAEKQLRRLVLDFCGIKTVGTHRFGFISRSPVIYRKVLLKRAFLIGRAETVRSYTKQLSNLMA